MIEWLNGAIKTLAELMYLLELAKEKEQVIYKIREGAIAKCVLGTASHIATDGRHLICFNTINVGWYSLDKDSPIGDSLLFRNYWHAWGYKNRIDNDQVEKS